MSRFNKIDHLGIAVPNLEEAIATYTTLFGVGPSHMEEVEDQGVMTAFFDLGESHFELLGVTKPSSPIARFLLRVPKGGLHHVCVEVDDIDAALAEYRDKGLRLIDEQPRQGAHGKLIAFIHPASTGGVLLELSQTL